jgi:putative membrane protein
MESRKSKLIILIITVLFAVFSCIHPVFPEEQLLQHFGTVLILLMPFFDLKPDKLRLSSFACICLFAIFHVVGARYIYSYVPYNDWLKEWLHLDLNTMLHTNRNHYDRFVHFSFGLLIFPYLYETINRQRNLTKAFGLLIAWSLIQAMSMCYELFEWSLTLTMTGTAAEDYNGQQGDAWDSQKDMAVAMLGSSIMVLAYCMRKDNKD